MGPERVANFLDIIHLAAIFYLAHCCAEERWFDACLVTLAMAGLVLLKWVVCP